MFQYKPTCLARSRNKLGFWWRAGRFALFLLLALLPRFAPAVQPATSSSPATASPVANQLISLNFPENVELKTVVEYVSQRVGMNIVYDEQIGNQRVTIRAPAGVTKDALLGLLESALRQKGFTLADADSPGLKRIVPAASLGTNAVATTQSISASGLTQPDAMVLTQLFQLQHADPQRVDMIIKPCLTQPGGNSVPLPEQRLLIVTDYATNIQRIAQVIKLIDQAKQEVEVQYVVLKNAEATQIATQVQQIVNAKQASVGAMPAPPLPGGLTIIPDAQSNQVAVIGPKDGVADALRAIASFDVPLGEQTRTYEFAFVSPEKIDGMVKELLDATARKQYQSAVDKDTRLLFVTAPPGVQEKIEQLKQSLDVPVSAQESPIQFYKLANTTASMVLTTIQGIQGEGGTGGEQGTSAGIGTSVQGGTQQTLQATPNPNFGGGATTPAGSLQPPQSLQPQQQPGQPQPPGSPVTNLPGGGGLTSSMNPGTIASGSIGGTEFQAGAASPYGQLEGSGHAAPLASVRTKDAIITGDPNTNSIIVVAPPSAQRVYEQLIRQLDKRRPQVLIECTIISLDTTNNFSLAVEVSAQGGAKNTQFFTFSNFGLSQLNPATGLPTGGIIPGTGFNGTVINTGVASVVIEALKGNSRARVMSSPRILVNDNATGTLTSVAESPYASVNQTNTNLTQTSFGGYAQAGTQIALTPHISESDYLQLEYAISVNSFTGTGTTTTPPPRATDAVASAVTIPDGSTIVVGGLNRKNFSQTESSVPILGDIPILKYLFSSRNDSDEESTLFVFVRPVILRDDNFNDLKYLSERDVNRAGVRGDYPASGAILMD